MAYYRTNQPYDHISTDRRTISPAGSTTDRRNCTYAVLEAGIPFSLRSNVYGDAQFVMEISNCQPLRIEYASKGWEYKMRDDAQDILPFLFLGPISTARSTDFIQHNGITMLLAVRDGRAASVNPRIMNPAFFPCAKDVETFTFDVMNEADLVHRFRSVIQRINQHLHARTERRPVAQLGDIGGKVLVFCEAGDTRSAAVIILYFMVVFGMTARGAVQAVQARRYSINISGEILRMIQNAEDILRAEREVAKNDIPCRYSSPQERIANRSQKRSMDVYCEEDEYMDMRLVEEMHRSGTAPFRDANT